MSNVPAHKPDTKPTEAKTRKPYHTPRMEDYGAVNDLTRRGTWEETDDPDAIYTPFY